LRKTLAADKTEIRMCGRYTLTHLPPNREVVMPEGRQVQLAPRYNIAPTQYAAVIPQTDAQRIHAFRWGLIPHWAEDMSIAAQTINARVETVLDRPAFRQAVRTGRCLVLADGFYEWKKTGAGKQPFRVTLKAAQPFFFAGISDTWKHPDGYRITSFSIITTPPNALMADIHDRMPAILSDDAALAWIDPRQDAEELVALLRPYEATAMEACAVSQSVGNVKNDFPRLIDPYLPPPTLFG
jgi:putative SOS response-associated peptidase YedK